MADNIKFGVLTVARKDNEAKIQMNNSIAALMKSIKAEVGIKIIDENEFMEMVRE